MSEVAPDGIPEELRAAADASLADRRPGDGAPAPDDATREEEAPPRPRYDIDPGKVQIIPLGGLGEIGKNMWAVRYADDILLLDAGLKFPSDDMPGVEFVLPDITYLVENKDKLRGILLTHGHEDHIGGTPYVLARVGPVPVYGTPMTLGLVEHKLREHKLLDSTPLERVKARQEVQLGAFKITFIQVTHSIADSVALALECPAGTVIYTGDYKLDQTPVDGQLTDYFTLSRLGEQGVLCLLSDSTGIDRAGTTPSERMVGHNLHAEIAKAKGRVIVTSFATNVHRVQQVMNVADALGRKVALIGRSMEKVCNKARELGYLEVADDLIVPWTAIDELPDHQVLVLTTGSQGEPMSVLARVAAKEHKKLSVGRGDTVIISAIPIPGNERSVARVINDLFELGAEVIYEAAAGMHVSGHASQEELKIMLNLTKPRYFVPIHGEFRHLVHHAELAFGMGIPAEHTFILKLGDVFELDESGAEVTGFVPAGKVLIDRRAAMVTDVGALRMELIQHRQQVARDGILFVTATVDEQQRIVAGPGFVSRGFPWPPENVDADFERQARQAMLVAIDKRRDNGDQLTLRAVQAAISDGLSKFLRKVGRKPVVVPLVQELHPEPLRLEEEFADVMDDDPDGPEPALTTRAVVASED